MLSSSSTIKKVALIFPFLLLVATGAGEKSEECNKKGISDAIAGGDLSFARYLANDVLYNHPNCRLQISRHYVQEADERLKKSRGESVLNHHPSSNQVATITKILKATSDRMDCWSWNTTKKQTVPVDLWNHCCSLMMTSDEPTTTLHFQEHYFDGCSLGNSRLCCDFFHGSSSYLHLPLLKELAVRLRVKTDDKDSQGVFLEERYDLQQDGFLRHYDTSGVLWPTAYLLSLCVAAPNACGIPEIYQAMAEANKSHPIAVELGAGIGAPSITLARTLERARSQKLQQVKNDQALVLATDKALHALDLIYVNAYISKAAVATEQIDHFDLLHLESLKERHAPNGFAIVLGSSLQELFNVTTHDENHQLWTTLDILLDSSNPYALAILAHSVDTIAPPEGQSNFQLLWQLSGDKFDMSTRFGETSDFFISVFTRSKTSDEKSPQSAEL